tara:strand:- start:205 stop:612 length:408 start_codon:yes stop_codon:yes gene_type:complete
MLWFSNILQVVQVLSAVGVVVLVLLQHGKGADMGAAFGSGSSGSLFGASGSANFLSRSTAGCAALFFVTTLGLAFVSNAPTQSAGSVMEGVTAPAAPVPSDVPGTNGAQTPAGDANSQIPATESPESNKASDIPK